MGVEAFEVAPGTGSTAGGADVPMFGAVECMAGEAVSGVVVEVGRSYFLRVIGWGEGGDDGPGAFGRDGVTGAAASVVAAAGPGVGEMGTAVFMADFDGGGGAVADGAAGLEGLVVGHG